MEKTMKARVQHKHDIEANWLKATNFTPLASEIIVYDPDENYDYPRIKIGDGETNINSLPFITENYAKIADIPTKPADIGAQPVGNYLTSIPSEYVTESELNAKGYLTDYTESDPTVPAWAKASTKPTYTAAEVGALAADTLPTAINTALAQAKASGEFDGKDGHDGYTPQKNVDYFDGKDGTSATHSWNGTTLTITSASGTSSANLKGEKGEKGDKGDKGETGANGTNGTSVTVKSVSESAADGGSNVVTFSDGKTVTIKNGSKGSSGTNGKDGKTPVRGTDYFTPADQEAVVQQVLTVMGMHIVGVVGANNDIVFTGNLPEGTYQLKYEDAEGNVQQIGTIEVGAEELVNWLPVSVGADGSIYNADDTPGYKANTRYSTSSGGETNHSGCYITGYIAVKKDQTLRVANMTMDKNAADGNWCFGYMFDTAKANAKKIQVDDGGAYTFDGLGAVWNDNGYLTQFTIPADGFIRLQASYIGSDSVVTLE